MGGAEILGGVVGLAIHIVIIVVCINLAESKGYNTVFAGLAGLFFGLWALLFYALMGNNTSRISYDDGGSYGIAPKSMAAPPQVARRCWSCSSPVAGQAATCQNCGARLQM